MFSPTIQGLLVQARVEELHRAAQTSNRRSPIAAPGSDDNRPQAVPLTTLIKRALGRVFDGLASSEEPAAIHGVELLGHSSATTRSQC